MRSATRMCRRVPRDARAAAGQRASGARPRLTATVLPAGLARLPFGARACLPLRSSRPSPRAVDRPDAKSARGSGVPHETIHDPVRLGFADRGALPLSTLRHSVSYLMGSAVARLSTGVQFGFGRAIVSGALRYGAESRSLRGERVIEESRLCAVRRAIARAACPSRPAPEAASRDGTIDGADGGIPGSDRRAIVGRCRTRGLQRHRRGHPRASTCHPRHRLGAGSWPEAARRDILSPSIPAGGGPPGCQVGTRVRCPARDDP